MPSALGYYLWMLLFGSTTMLIRLIRLGTLSPSSKDIRLRTAKLQGRMTKPTENYQLPECVCAGALQAEPLLSQNCLPLACPLTPTADLFSKCRRRATSHVRGPGEHR